MTLPEALQALRAAILPGLSQYVCRDVDGLFCPPDAEMVAVFDLHGAVYAHARDVAGEVWAALDAATDGHAYSWSQQKGRTHAEVLAAVDRALLRAEALEVRP
jgi:hypothetical protein